MSGSTSQIVFWVCALAMTGILVLLIAAGLFGLFSSRKEQDHSLYNRMVYQDQLSELEEDLQKGQITQEQYDETRREIELRIIEEADSGTAPKQSKLGWKSAIIFLVAIPVLALGIYYIVGNPSLINYAPHGEDSAHWDAQGNLTLSNKKAPTIEELKAYLKESPKDARAWLQLSYLYQGSKEPKLALEAIDKAFELSPNKIAQDSGMITERAVLMLETQEPDLIPKAQAELERAIIANPENTTATEILGMIAFHNKEYNKAAELWSSLLSIYKEGSPEALQLMDLIGEAKNRAAMDPFSNR